MKLYSILIHVFTAMVPSFLSIFKNVSFNRIHVRFLNSILVFVCLMVISYSNNAYAVVYTITANTNWSALVPVPTAADDIIVKGGAVLTVDVPGAVINTIQLGDNTNPDKGNGELAFNAGSQLTMAGPLTMGNGPKKGTLTMTAGGTLILPSVIDVTISGFDPGVGTVEFTGVGTLPGSNKMDEFYNLIINGGTTTLGRDLIVNNDLTLQAGTLDSDPAGDFDIDLSGDWNNTGGTFEERAGLVTLEGAAAQNIGPETFNNLRINNTVGDVTLQGDVTVDGTLTMSSGDILLNGNNLSIGPVGTISGGGAGSYIESDASQAGRLIQLYSGATPLGVNRTYPIGDAAGNYAPISVNIGAATFAAGAQMTIATDNTKHPANSSVTDFLNRYWEIVPTGITGLTYSMSATYQDGDIVGTEANIVGGRRVAPGGFFNLGAVNAPLNEISAAGLTDFVDFTGGEAAAFPIIFCCFKLSKNQELNKLTWTTLSEKNLSHFEIQKGKIVFGNINFGKIATINTKNFNGSSDFSTHYEFLDDSKSIGYAYYKIIAYDTDESISFVSTILASENNSEFKFGMKDNIIYFDQPSPFHIFDNNGKLLFHGLKERVSVENLPTGIYFLHSGPNSFKFSCF